MRGFPPAIEDTSPLIQKKLTEDIPAPTRKPAPALGPQTAKAANVPIAAIAAMERAMRGRRALEIQFLSHRHCGNRA